MKSLQITLCAILISIVTFAAFAPSLKNNFVNWDDDGYVEQNPYIRELSLAGVARIFAPSVYIEESQLYVPLVWLSYAIEYHFFGLNPFTYHLTNLIFHLFNGLLVFWLLFLISRNLFVATWTALLFGIHPLHVELVAWVTERKDVLYAFFFFGTLISYMYFLKKRDLKYYFLSLGLFLLALLSKPLAISLPFVLLLLDYFSSGAINKKSFVEKLPFLIMTVVYLWVGRFFPNHLQRVEPFHYRFFFSSYAVLFYLTKVVFPIKLSCLYPFPSTASGGLPLTFLLSPLPVLLLIATALVSLRRTRKIAFGFFFFFCAAFPALQFFPTGPSFIADRYMYVASVGVFFLIAELMVWMYQKIPKKHHSGGIIFAIILLMSIVCSLVILTRNRCAVWKDSMTLWNDALSKYPNLNWAHNQRGLLLQEQKDYGGALRDFKALLLYAPHDVDAYINLGNVYNDMGKSDEAIVAFKQGLKMGAEPDVAYFSLANTYAKLGNNGTAISFYKKTLELNPNNAAACYSLGVLYKKMDKKDDAVQMLSRTLEIAPGFLLAYHQLSQLYQEAGKSAEQFALYRQAVVRGVSFYEAYYVVGNFYQDAGKPREAIPLFQKAIELNAASAEANACLGAAYCAIGKNKDAIIWLKKALATDPKLAVAHNNIAVAYYYQKQYNLALRHCDKAIELGYQVPPKLLELLKPFRK